MRYPRARDGDWIQPRRHGYRLMCCDCGLVHVVNFRLKAGRIQFQAFRHPGATAASRRAKA
jgi:hypothetical protein